MNCQNHPEVAATAYCRACGKPVCDQCRRDAWGTVYCAEHAPAPAPVPPAAEPAGAPTGAQVPPSPYVAGPAAAPPSGYVYSDVSPGLALFLGMIPGVGAIYNGQYAKGLLHAIIWGVLVSIVNSNAAHGMEPIFGMLIAAWMAYMAFEAYHTARKRRLGEPVDEYSSILNLRGSHNIPIVAIGLIVMGVLFLLHTLNLLDFEYVVRYWPVLLIAAGVYLLFGRLSGRTGDPEVRHER
ncbi:MAG TPA: B-box zinc finger protein [Candidatus Acidoferrales bacterium]|nr:B-box zinc finger protein [Candidatus Acidoferrales bacterium]